MAGARFYKLQVKDILDVTSDAKVFVFKMTARQREHFVYHAGQFITLAIDTEDGEILRSYSMIDLYGYEDDIAICVKRIKDGHISNLLNDTLNVGDKVRVAPPAGTFQLSNTDAPIVCFAAGSGITPVFSIIREALETTDQPVRLIYANRNYESVMFYREIEELVRDFDLRLSTTYIMDDLHGYLDLRRVRQLVYKEVNSNFFLCGPGEFMAVVEEALNELHVDSGRIFSERFASPPVEAVAESIGQEKAAEQSGRTVSVSLNGEEHQVDYQEGEALLDAFLRAGLKPDYLCKTGYCSSCSAKLVAGEVKMRNNDCLTAELVQEGWILTCQSVCTEFPISVVYASKRSG